MPVPPEAEACALKAPLVLLELPDFDPILDLPNDLMHSAKGAVDKIKDLLSGSLALKVPAMRESKRSQNLPPDERAEYKRRQVATRQSFIEENRTLKQFKISARDRRIVNERWSRVTAPAAVYVKSRTPFSVKKQDNDELKEDIKDTLYHNTSKGGKCIDALLFASWAPVLFEDIIIKDRVTTARIVALLRAIFVLSENQMAKIVQPKLLALLTDFDNRLPQSMRQSVFHGLVHISSECQHWNSARNTWCFGMESAYGILSRYVTNRRHPASNLLISQGQNILTEALYNDNIEGILHNHGLADVSRLLRADAGGHELCGKPQAVMRHEKQEILRLLLNPPPHPLRVHALYKYKTASCHGRTFVIRSHALDEKMPKRSVQSYCIVFGSDGRVVALTGRGRRGTYLRIKVGRILGFYSLQCKDAGGYDSFHNYVKLAMFNALRPMHNILEPYTLSDTPTIQVLKLSRLHLQPAIHMIPGTEKAGVYGIH